VTQQLWRPDQCDAGEYTLLSWVTDTIAIGSIDQAMCPALLREECITAVVSIGKLAPPPGKVRGHHSRFADIEDQQRIPWTRSIEVANAIRRAAADGKTLVHSAASVSRSPALVTLALALERDILWTDAKAIVAQGRPITNIHPVTEATITIQPPGQSTRMPYSC